MFLAIRSPSRLTGVGRCALYPSASVPCPRTRSRRRSAEVAVVGKAISHSTILSQLKERNLRVAAIVSATAVLALVVLLALGRMGTEKPLPVGIPMQITDGEGWEGEPAISPDGTRVAYVSNELGNDDIYVADVLGGRSLRLTNDPGMDFAPTWFPDGTALAFVSDRTGARSVWKVGQFGGGATMLLENAEDPAISPNGTQIAFSTPEDSGELHIGVASLSDASDARKITTGEHGLWDHSAVAWSPDGRTLCYASQQNLWIAPLDRAAPRRLTAEGGGDRRPVWSTDGNYIYFDSLREGTLALWRVPSAGGGACANDTGNGL